ncbi:response regulator receiver protein [Flavobacteriaceae bacterium 3519-10]|nr:response regulator receiver protein [Flavobacteriaceae bacterium 3519-10]
MNGTIRCIILDDELLAVSYLQLLCQEIGGVEVVKAYNNPEAFLRDIRPDSCDVCIMDIEMPGMNGLEIAAKIPYMQIIFTTAYKEYAAEAYDLNVADYVRKPLQKERLRQALAKIKPAAGPEGKTAFEWNTGLGKTRIFTGSLLYFRTSAIDARDKTAFLEDQSVLTLKNINFRDLLGMLPESEFVQINKKEVIALKTVQAFTDTEIITARRGPDALPVKFQLTKAFRAGFIEKIQG